MRTSTKQIIPVVKPLLRTPISYYGGKQSMLKDILPLIPTHNIYTEVFFGGGAVYWAKEPADTEVINDINGEVVNFYRQLQNNYDELNALIQGSIHSRELHQDAYHIYQRPHLFTPVMRAWAFWISTNQGYGCQIGSGWGYGNTNKAPATCTNKKVSFNKSEYKHRIERTQIECNDAVKVLLSRDTADTFHYLDPPYIDVSQGHYAGYLRTDFERLLDVLGQIKGKFLLSTYPTDILAEYTLRNNWNTIMLDKPLGVVKVKAGSRPRKTEVLTANYLL